VEPWGPKHVGPPLDVLWGPEDHDTARWSAEVNRAPAKRAEEMGIHSRSGGNGTWRDIGRGRLRHVSDSRPTCLAITGLLLAVALTGCSPGQAAGSPTAGRTPTPTPTSSPSPVPGFTATGSMWLARDAATAALLYDGRVLIAGGRAFGGTVLALAELYDPKTGGFSRTGSMTTPRSGDTATLLPDGRVLIAGGFARADISMELSPSAVASAELYDPKTGTFTATGSMTIGRSGHTATLLPDGLVLVAGGSGDPGQALASAELYDPATGTFSPTGSMTAPRFEQTATLLKDGSVLIAGGMDSNSYPLGSAELYDPKSRSFSRTGSMTTPRSGDTGTLLSDGRVLMVGVLIGTTTSAELYDPRTGTFSQTGSMTTPRDNHTATLLSDGRVFIAGGNASAELYDPMTGTFSPAGSMPTARWGQTATLLSDGRVLIAGGSDANGGFASAELYQPATTPSATTSPSSTLGPTALATSRTRFSATGSMPTARGNGSTATLLSNGRVLICGGIDDSGQALASAELYDRATGTFSLTGSMTTSCWEAGWDGFGAPRWVSSPF
jgi:hypothetical protein